MRKNNPFIVIFIGLGIWTMVIFQILEPKYVTAQNESHTHEAHIHEEHRHLNFSLLDHVHSSSDISSLRKDMRRLIESCVVIEESISC